MSALADVSEVWPQILGALPSEAGCASLQSSVVSIQALARWPLVSVEEAQFQEAAGLPQVLRGASLFSVELAIREVVFPFFCYYVNLYTVHVTVLTFGKDATRT